MQLWSLVGCGQFLYIFGVEQSAKMKWEFGVSNQFENETEARHQNNNTFLQNKAIY